MREMKLPLRLEKFAEDHEGFVRIVDTHNFVIGDPMPEPYAQRFILCVNACKGHANNDLADCDRVFLSLKNNKLDDITTLTAQVKQLRSGLDEIAANTRPELGPAAPGFMKQIHWKATATLAATAPDSEAKPALPESKSVDPNTIKCGSLVVYCFPCAGHKTDAETCKKYLKLGESYVVERAIVHRFSTELFLNGFDGISFNSVMFEDAKAEVSDES